METTTSIFERGSILAVLDGRFLPCEEITIDISVDTQQINHWNGKQRTNVTDKEVTASLVTKREPHIRKTYSTLYVYTQDKEISISDVFSSSSYADTGGGQKWSVNMRGRTLSEQDR